MASEKLTPDGGSESEGPLRAEAVKRLHRKRKFRTDALSYVFVNAVLWGIWALTGADIGDDGVPWPVWVSGIWGAFLVLDAIKAFGDPGITEGDIGAEMRRLQDRRGPGM